MQKWFKSFNSGDFNLVDKPRSGRPPLLDIDDLKREMRKKPKAGTRELGRALGVSHSTVLYHLLEIGATTRKQDLIPHDLTRPQKQKRVDMCRELRKKSRHESDIWNRIVISDEKWVFLKNPDSDRHWVLLESDAVSVPMQNRIGKKGMI